MIQKKEASSKEKEKKPEKTEDKNEESKNEKGGKKVPQEKKFYADRPKQPLTAFMRFSNATREHVKSNHPQLKPNEMASILGTLWNEMKSEERTPYELAYAQEKKKYDEEMNKFYKKHP